MLNNQAQNCCMFQNVFTEFRPGAEEARFFCPFLRGDAGTKDDGKRTKFQKVGNLRSATGEKTDLSIPFGLCPRHSILLHR